MNKIIYTDCDGVILDWETAFHDWMEEKGYTLVDPDLYKMGPAYNISGKKAVSLIRQFNESAWMIDLPAFRDARSGIARLVEAGYKFHIISSLSDDRKAHMLRISNLKTIFGRDAWEDFTFLDTGADKDEVLKDVPKGAWWIEDKDENAIVGKELGLESLLVAHKHNEHVTEVPRFDTLNEIADHIIDSDWLEGDSE